MCRNYGILVGQVLVTKQDFHNDETREQLFNTIRELMALNIIPIINTNDAVSPPPPPEIYSEGILNIADNDSLASFLSSVHLTNNELDLTDHIPTRDTGLVPRDNREQEFDTVSYQSANTFSNITTPTNSRKNSEKQPR